MSAYNQLSETELLDFLKSSDHYAFTEIYERYWHYLYRSAYGILKDSEACDDMVQEIFVWLWINREKHITNTLKPYLYTAVKYKVANLIRHGKVKEVFYEHVVLNYKEAVADEHNIEVQELKIIIDQFTSNLPDRARQIFHLSRNELLSNREIAVTMGISEKTVENQMNINLKKLRLILGKASFWCTFL